MRIVVGIVMQRLICDDGCLWPCFLSSATKSSSEILMINQKVKITMGFECCTCEKEEWEAEIMRRLTDAQ